MVPASVVPDSVVPGSVVPGSVVPGSVAVKAPDSAAGPARDLENPKACCVTVIVWSAIMTDPSRAGPLFAAIERPTTPVPLADAPLVTLIHDSSARADHAQSAIAVTSIRTSAPPASTSTRVLSR